MLVKVYNDCIIRQSEIRDELMTHFYNRKPTGGVKRLIFYRKKNNLESEEALYLESLNWEIWMLEVDTYSVKDLIFSIDRYRGKMDRNTMGK